MRRIQNFLKEERAAAQMVEAAIIYPIVFLIIFLMIYMGLYILQAITVGTYAQKMAILASREISSPGYYTLVGQEKYSDAAIEMSSDGVPSLTRDKIYEGVGRTNCDIVYRYWRGSKALNDTGKTYYTQALQKMVGENSILAPENADVDVEISCENYVLAQFVTVKVEQELMHFGLLDFFGIESPKVSATARATVSDTDELVRNVDFVADALDALATRLGIDVNKARNTVQSACEKLGLYSE